MKNSSAKNIKSNHYIPFIAFVLSMILSNCDNHKINQKDNNNLDIEIVKKVKDTTLITDSKQFIVFVNAQAFEQQKSPISALGIDSIHQTNYWLKKDGDEIITTPKKLNRTLMFYDKKGRLIHKLTLQDDGEVFFNNQYHYDDQGLILMQKETNSARNLIEEIPMYSNDNLIVDKEHYNGKGKLIATGQIIYDVENKRSTETTQWLDSETKSRVIKEYNDQNKLAKQLHFEALMNHQLTNKPEKVLEFKYNDEGLILEKKLFKAWGQLEDYTSELYSTTSYAYDNKGYIIESKELKPNGTFQEHLIHTYKYDDQNNWIEKVTTKNKLPDSKLVRKIYYSTTQ